MGTDTGEDLYDVNEDMNNAKTPDPLDEDDNDKENDMLYDQVDDDKETPDILNEDDIDKENDALYEGGYNDAFLQTPTPPQIQTGSDGEELVGNTTSQGNITTTIT